MGALCRVATSFPGEGGEARSARTRVDAEHRDGLFGAHVIEWPVVVESELVALALLKARIILILYAVRFSHTAIQTKSRLFFKLG